ncbi:hypothetical protein NLG97_g7860 [Lecanicillium saksenae]|uniref:Uncharacterized protein n=1 Tax=Lecanicillium saksenae TaxID=468837 RepID=A0ACC1QKL8_9HYPO|nr:hypothetical protein NLG97_g7860 [Lecanicillium saksenae]
MQFTAVVAIFASAVAAVPAAILARDVCPGGLLNSNLQCCAVDVLGLADLECDVPSRMPSDGADFGKICSEQDGTQAMCCGVPVAGQALVCEPAIGA